MSHLSKKEKEKTAYDLKQRFRKDLIMYHIAEKQFNKTSFHKTSLNRKISFT